MDEHENKQDGKGGEEPVRLPEEKAQNTTRRIRRTPWGRPRSSERKAGRDRE